MASRRVTYEAPAAINISCVDLAISKLQLPPSLPDLVLLAVSGYIDTDERAHQLGGANPFRYPAKFEAEMPQSLIDMLSAHGVAYE
ncbi:uncharacterized protein ARMOST_17022 [Armillaria ostoyae]|uniref:Uncharacterized protein n=1 Tax=Armillaria ostoyae TaxID=47428 RepID=A0A284RXU3_ARMOS|nr:uncharacterized protein ARMOST_17022 [Armillaria ostoyae]